MIALAGMGRRLHLPQKRVHFIAIEAPAGAHGTMTRHGRAHFFEAFFQRQPVAKLAEIVCKARDQSFDVDLAQQRRRLAHHHRVVAETFHDQAEAGEFGKAALEAIDLVGFKFNDLRDQQSLTRDAARIERGFHAFVNEAFVRSVLVNDDQAVGGLCDDIGLV